MSRWRSFRSRLRPWSWPRRSGRCWIVRAAARLPLAPEELFGEHWALARVHWSTVDPILYAAAPEQHVPRPIDAYRTSFGALATAITPQQVSPAAARAL